MALSASWRGEDITLADVVRLIGLQDTAAEDLQVMVQFQTDSPLGNQAPMSSHLHTVVVNHQVRGMEVARTRLPISRMGTVQRFVADRGSDAVEVRGEQPPGLVELLGEWHQQQLFEVEFALLVNKDTDLRNWLAVREDTPLGVFGMFYLAVDDFDAYAERSAR
ncbi:hypothetical protein [Streptomyces sp. A1-5]|uniref:hypothetical protein n=1 Tax=Streptomyces sp. A1-5 TaxID=2738410 RepID=UPI001F170E92|nr:hypothetical protein [Streptomyces sp. A1-5]UJB46255.1 hypothetical protein HRD51_40995 [Streptomyces sp. A1-5]